LYRVVFSGRAEKAFRGLRPPYEERIKETIQRLGNNPRIPGTKRLGSAPVAQYRHRVGDYRILFDIDEERKTVEVLDIRRRGGRTYK